MTNPQMTKFLSASVRAFRERLHDAAYLGEGSYDLSYNDKVDAVIVDYEKRIRKSERKKK